MSLSNTSQTPEQVWARRYEDYEFEDPERCVHFKELFDKYLPRGGTCFEVGCFPGRYLAYLGRRFNYTVSGIDLVRDTKEILSKWLLNYDVKIGTIIEGDFLKFTPDSKYDVVCSFGFIEHFSDTQEIIHRHLQLLKPGGMLIISCPNFRKVQYLLHRWLDYENLQEHNVESMDFEKWSDVLLANDMEILHQGYYGTAGFWVEKRVNGASRWTFIRDIVASSLQYCMLFIDKVIHCPNAALSPLMLSISKKKRD